MPRLSAEVVGDMDNHRGKRSHNGTRYAGGSHDKKRDELKDDDDPQRYRARFLELARRSELDRQMGFAPVNSPGKPLIGWMLNMQTTLVPDEDWASGRAAIDFYFMGEDGGCFKATLSYSPYFLILSRNGHENAVEEYCRRRFEKIIESSQIVEREDLDLPNHLSGIKRKCIKLSFRNTSDLMTVRKSLAVIVKKNSKFGAHLNPLNQSSQANSGRNSNAMDYILSLCEYDLPYHLRVAIDLDIRVGLWYKIQYVGGIKGINITPLTSKDVRPDPIVLAFDIETTKMPLKFPDASNDHIMMISYMVNGHGFLIVNRDIVSQDIADFEYTPRADYPGRFSVHNSRDEKCLLEQFIAHIQVLRPHVFVTYNGDFFDWPFIEKRCSVHGIDLAHTIGIEKAGMNPGLSFVNCESEGEKNHEKEKDESKFMQCSGEFVGRFAVHMDCFCWVKRDSYLPAGSHGLKAVCALKLGYDPLELDPELMTPLAASDPQTLANYSVSDAVATYYLYMKYVQPFIFSLCNIIPLQPEEVLRKGTGTLCETLLMAQAYKANVLMPNKHEEPSERFHLGHLLETETYIGGHVEALEAGVFRSDIPCRFHIDPDTISRLRSELDRALIFFLEKEANTPIIEISDYSEVKKQVDEALEALQEKPNINVNPLIYHLDVGSMYPNIILTNRLQPSAMVDESTCAVCDYNLPGKRCQRPMPWSWRGEFYSAHSNEYRMIRRQLDSERFPAKNFDRKHPKSSKTQAFNDSKTRYGLASTKNWNQNQQGDTISFSELTEFEQRTLIRKRLADYSQKVYKRTRKSETVQRTSVVCQRENSFYIDTVRSFRDRRYEYKGLQKQWKRKFDEAVSVADAERIDEAGKLLVVYDSMQLAHKCLLNSFYGYVMRKGARWYSMEMGGIVCETGAKIITLARELVEKIGRPLELDTDGIWCMLPSGFPQNFAFKKVKGGSVTFSYPCVMLNHLLHDRFTNDQYHYFTDEKDTRSVQIGSENSIFFEIDGPYRAMVLPSSTEEGRQLKKRYAVFSDDGSLAELKGFEIKRRGELKLIKVFQGQLFRAFLGGGSLSECYGSVAKIADYWLDILYSRGAALSDEEIVELISENRSMSKALEDYGAQKSTSISTARRLSEFLGDQMVKEKGLACKFIIACKPVGVPVAQRAIPIAILSAAAEVRRHYLGRWLKDSQLAMGDIRDIVDWDYYLDRVGSMIQKLIVIPAASQMIANPVPRVSPPDWLLKKGLEGVSGGKKQQTIVSIFSRMGINSNNAAQKDIEDAITGPKIQESRGGLVSAIEDEKITIESSEYQMGHNFPASFPKSQSVNFNPMQDYSGWISSKKHEWAMMRLNIKNKKTRDDESNKIGNNALKETKKFNFTSMADSERLNFLKSTWQIISIEEVPGSFGDSYKIWILPSGGTSFKCLKLNVSRRIVFAPREKLASSLRKCEESGTNGENLFAIATKTFNRLPDGTPTPPSGLYELVIPESVYRQRLEPLIPTLINPVDGQIIDFYETDIPPAFKIICSLGCTASLVGNKWQLVDRAKKSLDEIPLSIEEIKQNDGVDYLSPPNVRFAFLAYLKSPHDSRQMFLFVLDDRSTNSERKPASLRVAVIDSSVRRQVAAIKLFVQQVLPSIIQENTHFYLSQDSVIDVDYFPNNESALRSVLSQLNTYLDARPLPTILLSYYDNQSLENCESSNSFRESFAFLFERVAIPILPVKIQNLTSFVFPPLDWQRSVARRLLEICLGCNRWLDEKLDFCRYARIPLGGVIGTAYEAGDLDTIFASDLFLARALQQKGYIIPWCPSKDIEMNKASKYELLHGYPNALHTSTIIDSSIRESNQGFYRNASIDFSISGSVINAVLEQQNILLAASEQNDGGIAMVGNRALINQTVVGSIPTPPPTVILIRNLLTEWISDSIQNNISQASILIDSFFYWISSGKSSILVPRRKTFLQNSTNILATSTASDPKDALTLPCIWESSCVYTVVRFLMKQAMERLNSIFKSLGCIVIYADDERILVNTMKNKVENAHAFADYIRTEITRTDGLSWLRLEPFQFWDRVLWRDRSNYAGISITAQSLKSILSKGPLFDKETKFIQSIDAPKKDQISIEPVSEGFKTSETQPDSFLSHSSREQITNLYNTKLELNLVSHLPPILKDPFYRIIKIYLEEENNQDQPIPEQVEEFDENKNTFKTKILQIISDINRLYQIPSARLTDDLCRKRFFPYLVGSHLDEVGPQNYTVAPLNFVKWLGNLLEADRKLNGPDIDALIKQSYALIGVREFSDEAVIFVDPCDSYCIPEVVCSRCYYTKDLDFCRDPDLLGCTEFSDLRDANAIKIKLSCPSCSAEYSLDEIQKYMLDDIEHLLMVSLKQDLECNRCHLVKPDMMGLSCNCTGSYHLTAKGPSFGSHLTLERRARIIARIAHTLHLDDVVYFVNSFVL